MQERPTPAAFAANIHNIDHGRKQNANAEFAGREVNDRISMTVGELEAIKQTMRNKMEEYQEKVMKISGRNNELVKENGRLTGLIQELTDAKNMSEMSDAMAALRVLPSGGAGDQVVDAEAERRRAELRRELLKGLEMIGGDGDTPLRGDDMGEGRRDRGGLRDRAYDLYQNMVQTYDPFRRDISFVSSRYGHAVSAVFMFIKSTCISSVIYTIIWGGIIIHLRLNSDTSLSDINGVVPSWTLYSAFPSSSALAYTLALIACMILSVVTALRKTISDHTHLIQDQLLHHNTGDHRPPRHFASSVMNPWDFTVADETLASDHRHFFAAQVKSLLSEDLLLERLLSRTAVDNVRLWARRVVGLSINLACLVSSWTAIIYLTIEKDNILPWLPSWAASLAAPVATSVIGAVLPAITFAITEFEHWDSSSTLVKHQLWRLYAGRQLNILINVISYFSMAKQQPLIDQLKSTVAYDTKFKCSTDAAGAGMFYLVLSEFFVSKSLMLAQHIAMTIFHVRPSEYSVSESVIDILYFQSLVWVALPLYPPGSILSLIFLFANFKFEKIKLIILRDRPSQTSSSSSSAHDTTRFFNLIYILTLVSCFSSYLFFLNSPWTCLDNGQHLGPFSQLPDHIPLSSLTQYAKQVNIYLLYTIVIQPAPYIFIATIMFVLWKISRSRVVAMEVLLTRTEALHVKEAAALKAEIDQKIKIIAAQRKAATLS